MEIRHHTPLRQARPVLSSGRLGIAEHLTVVSCLVLFTFPAFGQAVLYDNGPDADTGYYGVNFGATTINSFELSEEAVLSNVTLTVYDVDDRNVPKVLAWTISTEPTGGTILGSGFVELSRLGDPYLTRFLFFAWKMGFAIPKLSLPKGTYFLEIQQVATQWNTRAFWAVSAGPSAGYYSEVAPSAFGAAQVAPVASESFAVLGEWTAKQN
jgi:hypothetical protein